MIPDSLPFDSWARYNQTRRPYLLVDDIESAVSAAVESGAEIAHPPMKLAGHGTFAIFIQGGIQHGLWQV